VCGRGDVYIDYEPTQARALIRERMAALRSVTSAGLVIARDQCEQSLREALSLPIHRKTPTAAFRAPLPLETSATVQGF